MYANIRRKFSNQDCVSLFLAICGFSMDLQASAAPAYRGASSFMPAVPPMAKQTPQGRSVPLNKEDLQAKISEQTMHETEHWIEEFKASAEFPKVCAAPTDGTAKATTSTDGKMVAEKQAAKAAKRQRQKDRKVAEQLAAKTLPCPPTAAAPVEKSQPQSMPALGNVFTSKAATSCVMVAYAGDVLPSTPLDKVVSAAAAASMDVDEEVSYGEAKPINNEPLYKLNCANAKDCGAYGLKWHQFMLVKETEGTADASWSGVIWGHCQPCSGFEEGAFKREARRQVSR